MPIFMMNYSSSIERVSFQINGDHNNELLKYNSFNNRICTIRVEPNPLDKSRCSVIPSRLRVAITLQPILTPRNTKSNPPSQKDKSLRNSHPT